jgi:hypothetical protein
MLSHPPEMRGIRSRRTRAGDVVNRGRNPRKLAGKELGPQLH